MKQIPCFYGRHRASAINYYQPPAKSFIALNFEFQAKDTIHQIIVPKNSKFYFVIKRAFERNETLFIDKKIWKHQLTYC